MLTLWFRLGLYRFSRNREADKGKNKGKKTGQNEITPGGGTKEICGFMQCMLTMKKHREINVEIPSTECYDEFIQVEEAKAFHLIWMKRL